MNLERKAFAARRSMIDLQEIMDPHDDISACALDETTLSTVGRKGKSTIMVQIIEDGGGWAFSARMLDEEGFPLGW